jgi:thiamine biosynthesis protein ThiS
MNDSRVRVQINGEDREVPRGLSVAALLEHLDLHPGMVVVEQNGEILRRERYLEAPVSEGDAFELVHFVGGG